MTDDSEDRRLPSRLGMGPRADQEIAESFTNEPTPYAIDPADSLPRPVITTQYAEAPPLHPDTFLCMMDASEFFDSRGRSFAPEDVDRLPDGSYVLKERRGIFRRLVTVVPKRRPCVHYARQHVDLEDDKDRSVVVRLCTARRTDMGEFLSVGNSQVFGCSLRNPHDMASEMRMDAKDQELVETAERKAKGPKTFDLDEALAAVGVNDDEVPGGGIFR